MKYAQMFTGDFNTRMVVDRQQFLMCLDRATLVTKDAKKSPVLLSLGEETVKITSNGELGASYDELKADTEGEVIEISFNPRYLMDALKVIEDDLVQLLFVNALNPCIIRGTDHDNYTYLVLPLRLKS